MVTDTEKFSTDDVDTCYDYLVEQARIQGVDLSEIAQPIGRFNRWLHGVRPDMSWDVPHLRSYQDIIESTSYKPVRACISMPPRHGKTETGSISAPNWRLSQNLKNRTIFASYNQTAANRVSRNVLDLAKKVGIELAHNSKAVNEWETTEKGGFKSVGVGVGIAGYGADLCIIDDPFKNAEEANSQLIRDKVWHWFTQDIYTRLEPRASCIVVHTRWNDDDLIGRLIQKDLDDGTNDWQIINYRAIAEEDDPLGRQVGEALWPDRYTVNDLLEREKMLGSSEFSALYQQRPIPRSGHLFKCDKFNYLNSIPEDIVHSLRYWDLAGSVNGDWTVGTKIGCTSRRDYVILDVVRGQWSVAERVKHMVLAATGDGKNCLQYFEQESGVGAEERNKDIFRAMAEFPVTGERATKSKILRAEPVARALENGILYMVRGKWNHRLVQELGTFPFGKNDDQVDSLSGAYNKVVIASRVQFI